MRRSAKIGLFWWILYSYHFRDRDTVWIFILYSNSCDFNLISVLSYSNVPLGRILNPLVVYRYVYYVCEYILVIVANLKRFKWSLPYSIQTCKALTGTMCDEPLEMVTAWNKRWEGMRHLLFTVTVGKYGAGCEILRAHFLSTRPGNLLRAHGIRKPLKFHKILEQTNIRYILHKKTEYGS